MKISSNNDVEKRRAVLTATVVFVMLGVASTILPNISGIFPDLPELRLETIMGWICLLAGIMHAVYSSLTKDKKTTLPKLLQAAFYTLTGIYLLIFSSKVPLTINFILTIFLLLSSLLRILYASKIYPGKGTGWIVVFCISDIALSFMVSTGYPSGAGWALGLMFGICITLHGLTINLTSPYQRRRGLSESCQAS